MKAPAKPSAAELATDGPAAGELPGAAPDRTALIDRLRWKKFDVLDDGFVTLVDVMGDDAAVVQAARVSYGAGTKSVSDDRGLIRYLMRHAHSTPFEMAELKFLFRMPMDAWRQQIRHRTASVNEYSTRYSVAIDAAQTTAPDAWRSQAASNRQGSGGFLPADLGESLTDAEADLQTQARAVYEARLQAGVAREQARKDLPLSTYTEAYWKVDLHNLLHFLRAADGRARAERDPGLRHRGRRADRGPAVPADVGGVHGLPLGGDVPDRPGPRRDPAGWRRANRPRRTATSRSSPRRTRRGPS